MSQQTKKPRRDATSLLFGQVYRFQAGYLKELMLKRKKFGNEDRLSHTEARQRAREKIELELTDEEYERALAEIQQRQAPGLVISLHMMDAVESDPVSPAEPD